MDKANYETSQAIIPPGQTVRSEVSSSQRTVGQAGAPNHGLPGARPVVLVIWAGMFLGALAFVGRYSSSVPYGVDDWWYVPYLTGHARILPFLWEQTAQNRYPVTRAVFLGLLKLGGGDYRTVLFFEVLSLGMLSLAMIQAAKKVRGCTSYTDTFFPLVLLSWGLAQMHLLWASGIHYLVPTFLAFTLLVIIIRRGVDLTPGTGILAGITLVMLALASGSGLLYTFALGPWLLWCGIRAYRSAKPRARRYSLAIFGLALAAVTMVPLYFINLQHSNYGVSKNPNYWVKFKVAVSFLSGGYGAVGGLEVPGAAYLKTVGLEVAGLGYWQILGWFVFSLLTICSVVLAATVWARNASSASRALGLLFFMGGLGCVAGAIGWGREGLGPGPTYYYGLALPFLIFIYFAGVASCWRSVGVGIQVVVTASVVALFYTNTVTGLATARDLRRQLRPVEEALRAGLPPYLFVARYHEAIWPDIMGGPYGGHKDCVDWMRQERLGLFAHMQPNPLFEDVTLPPTPVQVDGLTWTKNQGEGTSAEAYAVFALPHSLNVAYVRVRGELSSNETGETMRRSRVFWKKSTDADFPPENFNYLLWDSQDGTWEGAVCVADTIDQIKLIPGADQIQAGVGPTQAEQKITFRIDELTFRIAGPPGKALASP